jgi:hypothetical protein
MVINISMKRTTTNYVYNKESNIASILNITTINIIDCNIDRIDYSTIKTILNL